MIKNYSLKMPGEVYSGADSLSKVCDIVKAAGAKKVAVFTGKSVMKNGLTDIVTRNVAAAGAEFCIFSGLANEPTYLQVQKIVDEFRAAGADFIIAIGGGSVIDTAKLASVLANGEYTVKDLLDDPSRAQKSVRSLMIPTTAGTGAEATPNAIVAVPEKELKVGIVSVAMLPDYVILDPVTIKDLPQSIAASTGVDALCHAIECYTGNKATPFSDLFALKALDTLLNDLEESCLNPDAMEAKNRVLIASFYAGVAITASGTTAVHALSYPLGGKYHIAHGVSNAMLLVPVMKFNEDAITDRLASAYDACCHGGKLTTAAEKSAYIITRLDEIVSRLGIPTSLKAFGITADDLDVLVAGAMDTKRLLNNNVKAVTPEDARAIYTTLLK